MICLGLLINITFGFASLGEINPIPQTRQFTPCHFSVMKSAIRLCTRRPDLGLLMAQSVPAVRRLSTREGSDTWRDAVALQVAFWQGTTEHGNSY